MLLQLQINGNNRQRIVKVTFFLVRNSRLSCDEKSSKLIEAISILIFLINANLAKKKRQLTCKYVSMILELI